MRALRSLLRRPSAIVSAIGIVIVVLAAVLGPMLYRHSPRELSRSVLQPPSEEHLMGTDNLGRSVLAQFLSGARISLLVGVSVAMIAASLGVTIGALAGYRGGGLDDVLMRFTEFFQTMPVFVLAIIVVAFLGPSLLNIILVLGVLGWPKMARVTRSQFLQLRSREFVEASAALGASHSRIAIATILPNALPSIVVTTSLLVAEAILLEAYLSFLGMGDPAAPSWGIMLYNAQQYLFQSWWMILFPGLGIFITVLLLNVLGDSINDALNPRQLYGTAR